MCRIYTIGLLRQVQDEKFIFLVTLLQKVLQYNEIPNKVPQAKSENLHFAVSIIDSTKDQIRKLKVVYDGENVNEIIELNKDALSIIEVGKTAIWSIRGFYDRDSFPHHGNSSIIGTINDVLVNEFDRRFSRNSVVLDVNGCIDSKHGKIS